MEKGTFQKLYETHYMRVYSYVMALAGKQCLAEELTQETFYRAFTARSGFRREASEATWLCAIARNLFYDEMRRQSKCAQEPPDLNVDSGMDVEGRRRSAMPPVGSTWRCRSWRSRTARCLNCVFSVICPFGKSAPSAVRRKTGRESPIIGPN